MRRKKEGDEEEEENSVKEEGKEGVRGGIIPWCLYVIGCLNN